MKQKLKTLRDLSDIQKDKQRKVGIEPDRLPESCNTVPVKDLRDAGIKRYLFYQNKFFKQSEIAKKHKDDFPRWSTIQHECSDLLGRMIEIWEFFNLTKEDFENVR